MRKLHFITPFLLTFMLFFACMNKNNTSEIVEETIDKKEAVTKKGLPTSVDVENSVVEWIGEKPTGSHNGTIMLEKGVVFTNKDGDLNGGEFTFNMKTIECTDLSGSKKESIEAHLKDEDFFNTEKYPYAHFKIETVNSKFISGMLTIKGISHRIKFPYTKKNVREYLAKITVDRTLFDIKYKSKTIFPELGDHFINDKFFIRLSPLYLDAEPVLLDKRK